MTEPTRRDTLLAAALAGVALGAADAHAAPAAARAPGLGDFDFLVGDWNVAHRRLKTRLANDTRWESFPGTSKLWLTLGGLGTVDDNVLHIPSGTYRAVGVRAFDAATGKWAIWWLDQRTPARIDPPVYGGFANGVGTFTGEDTFNGKPILVRFRWSEITANTAHWDQAFSPDGGATWETNWHMDFTRA